MKKRILYTLFAAAFSVSANGQITFEKGTNTVNGYSNEFDIPVHDKLTNNSQETEFRWVRTINTLTTGWDNAVCDIVQCHDVSVDSSDFSLPKGEVSEFIVHFYPDNKAGEGDVTIRVFAVNDPAVSSSAKFTTRVWGLGAPVFSAKTAVYPNPAKDILSIINEPAAKVCHIYSLNGSLLLSQNIENTSTVNISALPAGLYVAEIISDEKVIRNRFSISR